MEKLTGTTIEMAMTNLDAFDLCEWQEDIYNKLAEYENTELSPAEITKLRSEIEQLRTENKRLEKALEFAEKQCEEFRVSEEQGLAPEEQYFGDGFNWHGYFSDQAAAAEADKKGE